MATTKSEEISILRIEKGRMHFFVRGTTPLILNRLSEKAKHELLLPRGKKNAAEKASTLKHEPLAEFRAAPTRISDETAPTLLALPTTAFKGSMRSAALDMPGANKSQIGRLTYVPGEHIAVYGVPQVLCSVVRSADMNRTPDVRTRVILPEWACHVTVEFTQPILREQSVANLLAAAGITIGVGDWRPEKGSGTYGCFELVGADDPDFARIVATGGRAAQAAAMDDPTAYDDETSELLAWFDVEVKRRGFKLAA